jgi:hypothetical protein
LNFILPARFIGCCVDDDGGGGGGARVIHCDMYHTATSVGAATRIALRNTGPLDTIQDESNPQNFMIL